jgi:hypothetical protein
MQTQSASRLTLFLQGPSGHDLESQGSNKFRSLELLKVVQGYTGVGALAVRVIPSELHSDSAHVEIRERARFENPSWPQLFEVRHRPSKSVLWPWKDRALRPL